MLSEQTVEATAPAPYLVSRAARSGEGRGSGTEREDTEIRFSAGLELPRRSLRSTALSIGIHAAVVLALAMLFIPGVQNLPARVSHAVLIAPRLQPFRSTLRKVKLQLKLPVHSAPPKKIEAKVQPATPPPVHLESPKILPDLPPAPVASAPKSDLPKAEPLKPLEQVQPKKEPEAPRVVKQVTMGAFGDTHGVTPNPDQHAASNLPKLGSFDAEGGAQHGSGKSGRGVQMAAFGSDTGSTPGAGHAHGGVNTGGFGDGTAISGGGHGRNLRAASGDTPAEILFKPRPLYTAEARDLKIEGQVALEVILEATGKIQILRVVHALGHGLDEAAQEAARQIRFKPAVHDGAAVDTRATLYITFQLI